MRENKEDLFIVIEIVKNPLENVENILSVNSPIKKIDEDSKNLKNLKMVFYHLEAKEKNGGFDPKILFKEGFTIIVRTKILNHFSIDEKVV